MLIFGRSCRVVANIAFYDPRMWVTPEGSGWAWSRPRWNSRPILRKNIVLDEYKLYRAALDVLARSSAEASSIPPAPHDWSLDRDQLHCDTRS